MARLPAVALAVSIVAVSCASVAQRRVTAQEPDARPPVVEMVQIISKRYEHASIVLTTNKVFKHWPAIFHNDSTLTSAILDRLLHHAETVIIEGKSYRMKDRIEP